MQCLVSSLKIIALNQSTFLRRCLWFIWHKCKVKFSYRWIFVTYKRWNSRRLYCWRIWRGKCFSPSNTWAHPFTESSYSVQQVYRIDCYPSTCFSLCSQQCHYLSSCSCRFFYPRHVYVSCSLHTAVLLITVNLPSSRSEYVIRLGFFGTQAY